MARTTKKIAAKVMTKKEAASSAGKPAGL